MASTSRVVGDEQFAAAIDGMMREIADGIDGGLEPVVEKSGQKGVKLCRSNARSQGLVLTGEYAKGFRKRMKRAAHASSCEIGNARKPGLVHLLEKGHATIGGGRVPAYPHVAPAAEVAFEELEDGISKLVDRVLG